MKALPTLPKNCLSLLAHQRKTLQKKRSNRMLIGITVAFFVAWAPINIFCITKHLLTVRSMSVEMIFNFLFLQSISDLFSDPQVVMVFFIVSHLISMSSVILNPILYGFLNENFKKVNFIFYNKPF